jgi:hypothetical protein
MDFEIEVNLDNHSWHFGSVDALREHLDSLRLNIQLCKINRKKAIQAIQPEFANQIDAIEQAQQATLDELENSLKQSQRYQNE